MLDPVAIVVGVNDHIAGPEVVGDRVAHAAEVDRVDRADVAVGRLVGVAGAHEVGLDGRQVCGQFVIGTVGCDPVAIVPARRGVDTEHPGAVGQDGPDLQWQAGERGITPGEVEAEIAARTALGRVPTDEETAGAVLFLASDLSSAMTGQCVDVNGGEVFH